MKTKLLFAICFLAAGLLKAQIITTIAGTGIAGYSGDGGQATSAQLNEPYSIIMDAGGNIYFTEWFQNKIIRKVTPSGIISTVAGNGTGGYSGDGGQATNAKLADPSGIAFDSHGNLYISDDTNNVIRKVNSSGIITTIVGTGVAGYSGDGGQATLAQLNYPMGITFDSQDNLYIAEGNNNSIRMVNTAGIITTVAGNGFGGYGGDGGQATATELNDPTNVMTDAVGNIYITDFANNRIRKVDKTTGIITTIVGSGPPGYYQGSYSGDGGQAISATLYNPIDAKFDSQGNLYISDAYNQRIRKVNISGIITTIAGNGVIGYAGDGGLATTAKLNYPSGIFIDITGNLYTADQYNHRIRKIGLSTTSLPDANFRASSNIVCAGSTITFSDSTTNAVVTSYQWSFPGGNLVSGYTLTDASPKVIYNTPGMYAVTYTASNSAGQTSITKTAYINVQIAAANYNTAMSEGFETISVPSTDWSVS
ncbi:MAG: PKD domain-containing protein, partial [Bacteroidia bacterium]